jgi:ribonuclease P protein component
LEEKQTYSLGPNERLKSRKLIEQLFKEGKTFSVFPLRIYFVVEPIANKKLPMANLQFGVGVSTKNFKKAVDRNRVKRLIREAYRLQKNELKNKLKLNKMHMNLFFIFTGKELPSYDLVYEKLTIALQKLLIIADESTEADT